MGDFNFDIIEGRNSNFLNFFSSYGLKSQLPLEAQTTNLKSQIDVILSNFQPVKVGTYETYFSYHKCIYAIINKNTNNLNATKTSKKKENNNLDENITLNKCDKEREIREDKNIRKITENEMTILLDSKGYLEDSHLDLFGEIVNFYTNFKMQSVLYIQTPSFIMSIPHGKPNLQILYSSCPGSNIGHWICTYYDGKVNHVYDSMNSKSLNIDHETYLNRLYGNHIVNVFHRVQQQQNPYDCGLFAMAFAVTICLGGNPVSVRYNAQKMRTHAAEIFKRRVLIPFPSD